MARIRIVGVVAIVVASVASASVAGGVSARHDGVGSLAAAHATRPTGNPAVIAFYRKVVAATDAATGSQYAYTAAAPDEQLKIAPNHSWNVFTGTWPRPGYYPVANEFYIGARAGHVTFVSDTLIWDGHGPSFSTFGELLTARGEVELAGGAPALTTPTAAQFLSQPCEGPVHGAVAGISKVGGSSGYGLYGDFRSMRRAGANEVVVSSFPDGKGHVATETDVIARSTFLPRSGTEVVSAAPGQPGYTMHWTVSWYHVPLYPAKTNGSCLAIESGLTA